MSIKGHFDQTSAGKDQTPVPELYHCLYRQPEGNALKATCEREVNGHTGTFLFAATHLTKALAFSFSYHDSEIMCNGGIGKTTDEFAIICNRSQTLNAPRHIRVFAFSAEGFEHVGRPEHDSRQMVSPKDMPFDKTRLVFETQDVQDIMKQGLQIFSTDKTVDELFAENFFDTDRPHMTQEQWLHSLVQRPDFTWENKAQGINPNKLLLSEFSRLDAVTAKPAKLIP